MTRGEFDVWVTAHYQELRTVAIKKYGRQNGEDVLHNAVLSLLESQMLEVMPLTLAWPWAVSRMRGLHHNLVVSQQRHKTLKKAVKVANKRPTMSSVDSDHDQDGVPFAGSRVEIISVDDPLAASIQSEGERYYTTQVRELNGAPLGAHWSRWVGACPKCDGPTSLEVVTDREARVFSGGYTTTRQQVVFCLNGHRADYKRGQQPRSAKWSH